ncbi:MAG: AAA family ATPase [Leptospirales bacterium]|nr:AAA family ATPase [Leptospirales bacterium]
MQKSSPPGRAIAVINLKGGVGKTTLAVNLAAGLANRSDGTRNYSVLLVDLDSQASATSYMLGETPLDPENNIQHILAQWMAGKQPVVLPENITGRTSARNPVFNGTWPNLHLLQAFPGLREIEYGAYIKFASKSDVLERKKHYSILQFVLENARQDYDYIIFDCPPNYNWIAAGAVQMADDLIVPVIPDFLSTNGLRDLVLTVSEDIAMLSPRSGKRIRAIALMLWESNNNVYSQYIRDLREEQLTRLRNTSPHIKELLRDCEIWDGLTRRVLVQKLVQTYRAIVSEDAGQVSRSELDKMVDSILEWKRPEAENVEERG